MKNIYYLLYALFLAVLLPENLWAQCPAPVITNIGSPCAPMLSAYDPASSSNALIFDGFDDLVTMSDFNLGTANFTLEAWVKPVDNDYSYILSNRGGNTLTLGNWFSLIRSSAGKLEMELSAGNSNYTVITGEAVIPLNTWTHIAVVRSGTSFTFYLNGILDSVFTESVVRNFSGTLNNCSLGGWFYPNYNFYGAIDQLRVWTIARTSTDIITNMHQLISNPVSGLQNNYAMDDTLGTTVTDIASANNGTMLRGVSRELPSSAPVSNPLTSFVWSSGETTPTIILTAAGTYTVTATNALGCTGAASYIYNGPAVPGATIANATTACLGSTVTLSIANQIYNSNYSHQWQSAASEAGPYADIFGANAATYTATVNETLWYRDNLNCSEISESSVPIQITMTNGAECYCATMTPVIANIGSPCAPVLSAYDPASASNALFFDGVDDLVTMSDFNLGTADFTLEAWVKPVDNDYSYILSNRGNNTNAFGNWFNLIRASSGKLEMELSAGNSNYTVITGDAVIPLNTWTHIAVVRSGTSFTFYLNGILDTVFTGSVVRNFSGALNICNLGGWFWSGNYFNGTIDQLRVWTIARTSTDIIANMHQLISNPVSGLQNNYAMGDTLGTTVTDIASANNGTMVDGVSRELPSSAPVSNPLTSFVWSSGETTPTIILTAAGTYTVTATNALGCTGAASYIYSGTAPGTTIASAATACLGSTVNLSIANQAYNNNDPHQWQFATSEAGPYTDILGANAATYTATINETLWYRDNLSCGGAFYPSLPVLVSLVSCYCQPSIYYGCQYPVNIGRVILNTLDNDSGETCLNNGYSDFTNSPSLTTSLQGRTTYSMTVYVNTGNMGFAAFVDLNDDGVFDDVTEKVGHAPISYGSSSVSFLVDLGCNPNLGLHRLRVRGDYNVNGSFVTACGEGNYGEVEDYMINVIPYTLSCVQLANVYINTVSNNAALFSWMNDCAAHWEVMVQPSGTGIPVGSGVNLTTNSYTANGLTSNTNYEFYVRTVCIAGSIYSEWTGPIAFKTSPEPLGFGDNVWNVNCYNGSNFESFAGYYVDHAVNINTAITWDANTSPSSATGYVGGVVFPDYHSYRAKRKGFTPGCYVINILSHDDGTTLYINGQEVFTHLGCCDQHFGVWSGILDANSEVEFKTSDNIELSHSYYEFVMTGVAVTYYADADSDGFGNAAISQSACNQPAGYVANNTDCDDTNNGIYQTGTFFVDTDNDGYTNGTASVCYGATTPVGYKATSLGADCDDSNANIYQSATLFVDADNDGYDNGTQVVCYGAAIPADFQATTLGADCNDGDNTIYQSATLFIDADNDNYDGGTAVVCYGASIPAGFKATTLGTDCNDAVAAINAGATEIPFNGIDENCNGLTDENGQLVTSLLSNVCNTTLASIGSLVGITTVAGYPTITGYRVRATNGAEVQTIERGVPNFTMQMFASFSYATTYTIDIELERNGIWMGYYGPTCQISTPAILAEGGAAAISPLQCGITLPKINTLVATTSIQGVTGYRFRVTNMTDVVGPNQVQIVTRTLNWFTLQMLTRSNYGTTYQIEVAVKTTGDFGGYGSPCEISSPQAPSLINCEATIATNTSLIACTSLAGVTQYRFQVTRDSDGASTTIDRSSNYFTYNNVPLAIQTPGAFYNVRVAVMTSGIWSPFGDICQITSPGAPAAKAGSAVADTMVDFKAVASPNPFNADFGIEITTTSQDNVSVKVYDMLGRMVESTEVKVSDLNATKVGAQYPAGVYNVIVSQSGIVKTVRVIKR